MINTRTKNKAFFSLVKWICYVLGCLLITFQSGCNEQNDYIIQTDLNIRMPDSVTSMTVAESQERGKIFLKEIKANTIHKSIPGVEIKNLQGRTYNLQDLISKHTIIVASDAYCGFGHEGITSVFPTALDSLKSELEDFQILCLAKITENDFEDSERFDGFVDELVALYKDVYIIEDSMAFRMNMYGNPMRYYVSQAQEVAYMATGLSNVEYQIAEIREHTSAMRTD